MSFSLKFKGNFRGALPGLSTFLSPLDIVGSLLGLIVPVADAALLLLAGFKIAIQIILMPILFLLGLVSGVTGFLAVIIQSLRTAFDSLAANLEFTLAQTQYVGPANQFQVATAGYFVTGNGQLLQAPDIFNNAAVDATVVVIAYVSNGVGVSLNSALSGVFPPFVSPICAVVAAPTSTIPPGTYFVRYSHVGDAGETFAGPADTVTTTLTNPGIHVDIETGPHGVAAYVYIGTDQYDMFRAASLPAMPGSTLLLALPGLAAAPVILNPIDDAFRPSANNIPYELNFTTNGVLGVTWKSPRKKSDMYVVNLYLLNPATTMYDLVHAYDVTETGELHTLSLGDYVAESGTYKVNVSTTAGAVESTVTYVAPEYLTADSGQLEADVTANTLNIVFSTQREIAHNIRMDLYHVPTVGPEVLVGTAELPTDGFDHSLVTPFAPVPAAPGFFALVPGEVYRVLIVDLGPGPIYAAGETLYTPTLTYVVPVPQPADFTHIVATMTDIQEKPVSGVFRFLSSITQLILMLFRNLEKLLHNLEASIGAAANRKLGMELMIKYFEDTIDNLKKIIEDIKKFLTMLMKFKLMFSAGFNFGDVYIFKYDGPLNDFGAAATAEFVDGLPGVTPASAAMQAELFIGTSPGARAFLNLMFGA